MGFKTLEQQHAAVESARVERAKSETLAQVYEEHQDWVRCIANDKMVLETILRWVDYDDKVLPTKAIFDQAIFENPEQLKVFVRRPLESNNVVLFPLRLMSRILMPSASMSIS